MSSPEPRELFPPVKFFGTRLDAKMAQGDVDFTPRPVPIEEVDAGEAPYEDVNSDPKVSFSSAPGSVESYSDLIPQPEDLNAPVEKGLPLPLETETGTLLSLDSLRETSVGAKMPPAETSTSSQDTTRSSLSAVK